MFANVTNSVPYYMTGTTTTYPKYDDWMNSDWMNSDWMNSDWMSGNSLVVVATIVNVLGLLLFYKEARDSARDAIHWQARFRKAADDYTNEKNEAEEERQRLVRKFRMSEAKLKEKRKQLESLQDAIYLSIEDREEIGTLFTELIHEFPDSISFVQEIAGHLHISITVEPKKKRKSREQPIRRQPKRTTAPTRFIYNDDSVSAVHENRQPKRTAAPTRFVFGEENVSAIH